MEIIKALILGLVQGFTEFLPISSSGHLALFAGDEDSFGLHFIVLLHFGTLFSIFVYYRRDVRDVLSGGLRLVPAALRALARKEPFGNFLANDPSARLALMIIVGTIPTGVIGLGLKPLVEFSIAPGHIRIVGACFIVTGVLMYFVDRFPSRGKPLSNVTLRDAITIGIFQGIAAMPGISRSGSTVFAAVMRGVERKDAARFSFLMAVPALIGANILEMKDASGSIELVPAAVGIVAAFFAGYLSLVVLVRVLTSQKLRYFSGYLVTLGLLVLLFSR